MTVVARSRAPGGGNRTEDWDVAVTQLDGRVGAIESSLITITDALRSLNNKLDDRGRIQWPALGVMFSVLVAVGGLVYWPMQQTQNRFEGQITHISDTAVSKEDFNLITTAGKERRDDNLRVAEARFTRLEADLDQLQKLIVPRGEHEEHWRGQAARDIELQREIDTNTSQLAGIYSPKDELAALQRHIEDLDRMIRQQVSPRQP
jgi:hypothetical protein